MKRQPITVKVTAHFDALPKAAMMGERGPTRLDAEISRLRKPKVGNT
jgi:hypothetical protein